MKILDCFMELKGFCNSRMETTSINFLNLLYYEKVQSNREFPFP